MDSLLIEKICKRVLNEYLSVSDDVLELSEECFHLYMETFYNEEWQYKLSQNGKLMKCKSKVYDLKEYDDLRLGELIDTLEVKLFGYSKEHITYEEYENILEDSGLAVRQFIPELRKIELFMPIPFDGKYGNNEWLNVKATINHEIKHALQSSKRKGGTIITNAYRQSTSTNDYNDIESGEEKEVIHFIKVAYYALHQDEVDSKIQELYFQLSNNGYSNDYKHFNAYKEMSTVLEWYKLTKRIMVDGETLNNDKLELLKNKFPSIVRQTLGISVSNWVRHCENGVRRFYKQLRRMVQRHNNEIKFGMEQK